MRRWIPNRTIVRERASGTMPLWYRLVRNGSVLVARLMYGFTVLGADNVPESGGVIVAANHSRNSDTAFAILAIPRRMHVVVKKEAFRSPLARLLRLVAFPVDRAKVDYGALRKARELLSAGSVVGIAPEGSRRGRHMPEDPPKGGMAWLALRSGSPVLPVHLGSAPGLSARLRGERMTVRIGEPVTIDRAVRGGRAYREVSAAILHDIYAMGREGCQGQEERSHVASEKRRREP